MKNKVEEYLCLPYSTVVIPDLTTDNESCYVACHPELEGCMSHGDTRAEALHNLAEVTELYISTLLDKGLEVPSPQRTEITWDWDVARPTSQVETDRWPAITPPVFAPVP